MNSTAYIATTLAGKRAQRLLSRDASTAIITEAASRTGLPYQEARQTAQSALDSHFRSAKSDG